MCCNTHGDEHDEEVDPHGTIGEPTEFLKRPDLANEETCERPHETADGVAKLELRGFRERFSIGDDNDRNVANELNGLQDIEQISGPLTVEAVGDVPVRSTRIFVGIKT